MVKRGTARKDAHRASANLQDARPEAAHGRSPDSDRPKAWLEYKQLSRNPKRAADSVPCRPPYRRQGDVLRDPCRCARCAPWWHHRTPWPPRNRRRAAPRDRAAQATPHRTTCTARRQTPLRTGDKLATSQDTAIRACIARKAPCPAARRARTGSATAFRPPPRRPHPVIGGFFPCSPHTGTVTARPLQKPTGFASRIHSLFAQRNAKRR